MTSRRVLLTVGALLSCCCVSVLSFSAGPADSVCNDATQTPTGHGVSAQTSVSPYQLVVGVASYDSSDTSTPVTGNTGADPEIGHGEAELWSIFSHENHKIVHTQNTKKTEHILHN